MNCIFMTLSRLAGSQSLKLTVLCHVTTERSQQLSSYNPFIYQSSETSSTFNVTHIEYSIFIILTNAVHSPLVVHKNHVKRHGKCTFNIFNKVIFAQMQFT